MMTKLTTTILGALIAFVMAWGVSAPSIAQEISPEHLALARKYVDLTDKSQIYERALIQTGIDTMRTIVTQNPEIDQETSDAIGQVILSYEDEKNNLFDQFARVYALRFTVEELTAINEFYESDVGQKLATENAQAARDLAAVMQVFKNNLSTEFFSRVRAELRSKDIEI